MNDNGSMLRDSVLDKYADILAASSLKVVLDETLPEMGMVMHVGYGTWAALQRKIGAKNETGAMDKR